MTTSTTVPHAAEERISSSYDLADESGIVWLRNPGELHGAWLREGFITTRWRRGRPAVTPLIVFAYAELAPRRGGQSTRRRFWYRTDHDGAYGPWDHPIEAVDPVTIRPRQWARQWVGPRCIVLPDAPGWHQHEYGP